MTVLRRPSTKLRTRFSLLAPLAALSLAGCGLNSVPTAEEKVNASWGDLQADYQRRADLIPNLVETVRGYAQQERTVLTEVTEARASATRVTLSAADLDDPAKVRAFAEAQGRLSAAILPLQRLQEAYPDLKSNQNFLALQSQLEGTENRITIARRDYIEAVRAYNTELRTWPGIIWAKTIYASHKPMETFTATADADKPPNVKF